MSQAGYQKAVKVRAAGSTTAYVELLGISAGMNAAGEMLDDTDFTSTGWRSRIVGLRDYSFSITANYTNGNSAQNLVRSAFLNGTGLEVQYLPTGTKGFEGSCYVETFNPTGDVGGLETIEFSLQSDGTALTTV